MTAFVAFPKIPRLKRGCVITEKLDGTNASIVITENFQFLTGSRNRWITPQDDNYGFSRWAHEHREELMGLGIGTHYGEWWGSGVQRGYGIDEKRFSLFNSLRWADPVTRPACCHVVPILAKCDFSVEAVDRCINLLRTTGSVAAPGFSKPEGIVCYHVASRQYFKTTIDKDSEPKGRVVL